MDAICCKRSSATGSAYAVLRAVSGTGVGFPITYCYGLASHDAVYAALVIMQQ